MMQILLLSLTIILCIILSAFFSGSELAYSSVNTVRLETLEKDGNKKASRALKIVNNFDRALSTILIGNNLVNIAVSSLVSVLLIVLFGQVNGVKYSTLGTFVITVLIIIFGETIPKISARRNPTKKAMNYSFFISILMDVFFPVIFAVTGLIKVITSPFKGEKNEDVEESVEELQSIIETANSEGILDKDDTDLLKNAIDFSETTASSVMTARVDVLALSIDEEWEKILNFIDNSKYTRIPVYKGSIDNIIGILHLNSFYHTLIMNNNNAFNLEDILLKPCFAYKTTKLPTVLNLLKSSKQHIAIVTDEYSGTLGIISMEDVLEQLVGEIWDETDIVENEIIPVSDSSYILDGDVSIQDFIGLFNLDEEELNVDSETLGGLVVEQLNHFPEEGESFSFLNMTFKVLKMEKRRVAKVSVSKE